MMTDSFERVASFSIRGIPKAQPRPQAYARRMGNKFVARVYDPGTAAEWKYRMYRLIVPPKDHDKGGVFSLELTFYFPRPKRLNKPRANELAHPHAQRPDLDNLAKAVLDVLTERGWWHDDSQVAELMVSKWWVPKGRDDECGLEVVIEREWT